MVLKYVLLLAGVGLLATLTLLHTSLWFLWHLLPAGNIQLAANHSQNTPISTYIIPYLAPEVGFVAPHARRIAVSRTEKGALLAAVPRKLGRNDLRRTLAQAGWQTRRFGVVILATTGTRQTELVHVSPREAAFQTLANWLKRSVPNRPVLIATATTNTLPHPEGPVAAIVRRQGEEVTLAVASQLPEIFEHTASQPDNHAAEIDRLSLAVPSSFISSLTPAAREQWNKNIQARFNFVHTQPDFLATVSAQEKAFVEIEDSKATLAVAGNPAPFIAAITQAVATEEAFLRPARRAFQLPDGAIGHEQVPGEVRPVFASSSREGCQQELGLWLCQNSSSAAVATTQSAASAALAAAQGPWRLEASAPYLGETPLSIFDSVSATGSEEYLFVRAKILARW